MTSKIMINVPLNRVEGDLDISVEIEDGIVTDAWCSGTMYRGFEKILLGRGALDGLVITPRICGICSTAHLMCSALALDMIAEVEPPPDAVRVRNVSLMSEIIQSDMRHAFLMFTADFGNPIYENNTLYQEAVKRYEPFKGTAVIEVISETKKILEIVAILGGQWPHSSFMVPGGVASMPNQDDIVKCRLLVKQYRNWYEQIVLGCTIERWQEIKSIQDIDNWLDECDAHRKSHLGFYIQYARMIGLDKIGKGHDSFISFGSLGLPEGTSLIDKSDQGLLSPTGFIQNARIESFDCKKISEHVAYSWFHDTEGGVYPFDGETEPYATGYEGKKYSWSKAPRYNNLPAETGPLAEMLLSESPLFIDLMEKKGGSVFTRQLARLTRPVELMPIMELWLSEIEPDGVFYAPHKEIVDGEGYGITQVSRGALGHWVKVKDSKITKYQIISPTTWNLSPRDSNGIRGPAEEALIGTKIKNIDQPVELGHIVRSFDACLVCTVHAIDNKKNKSRIQV